jgi:C_GCAxxG_C_C family probable redox protein
MENIEDQAILDFRSGLNCAQAVFSACSDRLGYDKELALSITAGFGGGMGRLQETCGVVTGAFMVIGIYNSQQYPDNLTRKEMSYAMIRKFNDSFVDIYQTNSCSKLINCDLSTPEGRALAHENQLHETICEVCMATSFRLLKELIPPLNR